LGDSIDSDAVLEVWEVAVAAEPHSAPVWVHGDIASGNLLVRNGRLAAVIDFGCSSVGDPACDLVIAWRLMRADSRDVFRALLEVDDSVWTRARGWALWKPLLRLAQDHERELTSPLAGARRPSRAADIVAEVLADHHSTVG
jgi:aminoglycoside phosphotransferase (APT) family kinase protein